MIVHRQPDGRTLLDREALAALLGRSAETIRRRCTAAAVHVPDRRVLYDAEHAEAELARHPARRATAS